METPTAAPRTVPPTGDDIALLGFAQSFELTARDLYQAALDGGLADHDLSEVFTTLRNNHEEYANRLLGILGVDAPQHRDDALFDELVGGFEGGDAAAVATAGRELEATAVATHAELLGQLTDVDAIAAIASIVIVEARHGTVLTDIAGDGDDLDAMLDRRRGTVASTCPGVRLENPLIAGDQPESVGLSRRQLFELSATSVGLTALLAACGSEEEPPAPGRVGNAPDVTALPDEEVNDVVFLRTLTSLEHSIAEVYTTLADLDGVDDGVVELLSRFTDDHVATAEALAELTTAAGGEPYECANAWVMERTLQPLLDHITGATVDDEEIPPTDDPTRDALTTAGALETIAAATAQQYIERLADGALRVEVIRAGAAASRRAATVALRANPPPGGYVSPALTDGEEVVPDENGLTPQFAVYARFGQLSPVTAVVGATDEEGLRFSTNIETPAENAYVYESQSCPA